LPGYEDVNDADRLCRDPAMRWAVGDRAIAGSAVSASQMGRFETERLTRPEDLAALTDLFGRWIDKVHQRRPPKIIALNNGFRARARLTANKRAGPTMATSAPLAKVKRR
jgi:hypothetical protein